MKNNTKKEPFLLIESVFKLLSHCSLTCLFTLAKGLSFVIAYTPNQISRQTKDNIALCFNKKIQQQQTELYRASINHTVCSLIEMASLWHQPMDKVLALIKNECLSDEYINDRQAKIIIAPHFGSWELLNLWLAQKGELFSLYKPARTKTLDEYILRKRKRNGAILVGTNTAGLRSLLKGLKQGASVMILPDQKPSKGSAQINAPFYGYSAPTSLLINSLIKKVKCSVYIAAAVRNIDDANFSIQLNKLDETKFSAQAQQSADYLNQSIEQFIAIDEAQYQWSYRRFSKKTYLDHQ